MESGLQLANSESKKEIDATDFRKKVGCLRYLLHTRPDLSYSFGVMSRYMQSPRESHGAAMRHCLRYLPGTTKLGDLNLDKTVNFRKMKQILISFEDFIN